MNAEEKLQLIDQLRYGFAQAILNILKDESDISPSDLSVDIHFHSVYANPKFLLEAAKNLGWEYEENNAKWRHSNENFGHTTIFFK